MDKIFRRPTQLGNTPKRKECEKNRKRNTFINFRVTPEERRLIEARVAASSLPKARFYIESMLYQTILVKGNVKTFSELNKRMEEIAEAIDRNPKLEDLSLDHAACLKTILEILDRRYGKE